jgi:large subunit ribosomal protein L24
VKSRIKKDDIVIVRSGKDRGVKGRVLAVMPDEGRALVEHVNVVRKHRRPRGQRDRGGIVSMEAPVPVCKLMAISDDRPTRTRIETDEQGQRRRVSVRTGKAI